MVQRARWVGSSQERSCGRHLLLGPDPSLQNMRQTGLLYVLEIKHKAPMCLHSIFEL